MLVGLPRARVAHHDPGAQDGGRGGPHAALDLDLGPELRLLVVILKALALIKLILADDACAIAGDVAGGDVVQARERVAVLAEVEDVNGARDVDAVGDVRGDGQIIEGGQVPDHADALGEQGVARIV